MVGRQRLQDAFLPAGSCRCVDTLSPVVGGVGIVTLRRTHADCFLNAGTCCVCHIWSQVELQQIRNTQPELLENPEAQQQIQQLSQADDVLQQRKAAVTQLALVLELAKDLEAAQASLDAQQQRPGAAASLMDDPEQLAQMLGVLDDE
jgi:hypothetical protein